MYIPSYFKMEDREAMHRFIEANSFAILFSNHQDELVATHLPLLFQERKVAVGEESVQPVLVGHFARANPQWKALDGQEVLVVFHGPHAYISPSWYAESDAVPTWNYVAVHVRGVCRIVQDENRVQQALSDIVRYYEPKSPLLDHLNEEFYVKMARGVVAFEIEITSMEGKVKLSQNKSVESIQNVIAALSNSERPLDNETAEWMREVLAAKRISTQEKG